jgi:glycosyltransferase involved in cell wall biosynthesis
MSFNENTEEQNDRKQIIRRCYQCAPRRVHRTIARLLREPSEFAARNAARLVDDLFDEQFGLIFLNALELKDNESRNEVIVSFLARKQYEPVVRAITEFMENGVGDSQGLTRQQLVIGASALLEVQPRGWWHFVRNLFLSDAEGARAILMSMVRGRSISDQPFTSELKESDAADFLLWAYREIPQRDDTAGGYLTDLDLMDHLRSAALRDLVGRGTTEAVAAVTRLAAELPNLDWLKYQVIDARQIASARTWTRREPATIVAMIASFGPQLDIRSTSSIIFEAAVAFDNANSGSQPDVRAILNHPLVAIENPNVASAPNTVKRRRILLIATEWYSKHGGISTLNRNLCVALASVGHDVVCFVADPTSDEISDAARSNVRLVGSAFDPVIRGDNERLLLFGRSTISPFVPELVIGHDHITGSAAYHIASRVLDGVPYVHFVHTLPEESERFKTRNEESVLIGDAKADVQLRQCRDAKLVVCVGPRIHREIQTRVGQNYDIPVVRFCPGLDEALLAKTIDVSKVLSSYCLLLARLEDGRLKGADIACQMIHSLNKDWSWPVAKRPTLILRGFNPENFRRDINSILEGSMESYLRYLMPRAYSSDSAVIADDIRMSSVVLMPSRYEGFGLVALEGIAAGVPVLVTSTSGIGELLVENESVIGSSLARDCVADVDGYDSEATSKEWAIRVHKIMDDPRAAYSQAEQLRTLLKPLLNWRTVVTELSKEFESIL